jgi:hypothetical protein
MATKEHATRQRHGRGARADRGALQILNRQRGCYREHRAGCAERREVSNCNCAACMPSNWPETNGPRCEMSRKIAALEAEIAELRADRERLAKIQALIAGPWPEVMCLNHCDWIGREEELESDEAGSLPHCPKCGSNSAILDMHEVELKNWLIDAARKASA